MKSLKSKLNRSLKMSYQIIITIKKVANFVFGFFIVYYYKLNTKEIKEFFSFPLYILLYI